MERKTIRPKKLRKQEVEQSVLELARERVATIYDRFDHVVVMFSGGKDSTIVLNLALEEARRRGRTPVDVIHFDEEAIPYQTEDYVRRVASLPEVSLRWYCLPVKHRNACSRRSPYWYPWDPDCPELWVRDLPPEALTELPAEVWTPKQYTIPELTPRMFDPAEYGLVCMMMGLRADESMMRLRSVTSRREDNYIHVRPDSPGNVYTASPIYDWRTSDVWTAPKLLGWDYNHAYDAMDKVGLSPHQQRCAPPFGEEPIGNLWMFRECFPEIWGRMQRRVPGAATAARYSNTELYGWGGISKPDKMTWQEYIRHLLMKWPEKERTQIARAIRQAMERHYSRTRDPILPDVEHPYTGVSWEFLAKMAFRGNLKGRMTKAYRSEHELESQLARYKEALDRYNEEQGEGG